MNSDDKFIMDPLDEKLVSAFPGRVVRKDLVKKLKVGFNIPVYVLEYLLGKYCSTTDEDEIKTGVELVKQTITERIVRSDETELIKARLQRSGSLKLIDLVTATFVRGREVVVLEHEDERVHFRMDVAAQLDGAWLVEGNAA